MEETKNDEVLLTEEEVWSVVEFARAAYANVYGNVLTPDIVNARLKDVTMNPMAATTEGLERALADPKNHEKELRGYAEAFEIQSLPYKRMIHYLGNMLSFDLTFNCVNAKFEDYKSKAYQKDYDILRDFFRKFNYKKEFSTIVKQLIRGETFFGILRDEGDDGYVIQELPSDYCKIDGRWEYGFLYSFNYYWFMQQGVKLDFYPDVFKRGFNRVMEGGNKKYDPTMPLDSRGQSSWVYWVDCSPADGFWAWKFTPEIATRVPYFSALFSDLVLQPMVRNLQKNQYIAAAYKILFGEVGLLNRDQKATVKDALSVSPDTLGKFLSLMKTGLGDTIKVATAPLQNVQGISFPLSDSIEMYDTYLRTTLATSGINSNLIFTNSNKPNAIETQLSLNTDEQLMMQLYPYFADFLAYQVNRRTSKFKFKFTFEGTNFFTNRAERLSRQTDLIPNGIILPQKIAAAIGMDFFDFQAQLDEARANGWTDNLTPIVSAFQMGGLGSGKPTNDKGGRPQKSANTLSEEGSQTRENGGNLDRGGKV